MDPFSSYHLTPRASLNRVRIVDVPGGLPDPDVRGQTAYDLVSAESIANRVREHGALLHIGARAQLDPTRLLPLLSRSMTAEDQRICDTALAIARAVGRALGYLLLTLRRGDAVNRQARDDWDDSDWNHWSRIRTIWLGGGIASGQFGPALRTHAAEVLAEHGVDDVAIYLAAYPAALPLIGAARSVPAGSQAALVFDFGTSLIKRAQAEYRGESLARLRLLAPLPGPQIVPSHGTDPSAADVSSLGDYMVSVLAHTWHEAAASGAALAPELVVSLASYVHNGQPIPRQGGIYSYLHVLSPTLADWLSARLSARTGRDLKVSLVHDGTAAARAYAGEEHAAVVTLGTALGVGFPPPADTVRLLASDWALVTRVRHAISPRARAAPAGSPRHLLSSRYPRNPA